jgi:hypothetical protein
MKNPQSHCASLLLLPALFGLACGSSPSGSPTDAGGGPSGLAVVHADKDYTSVLLSLVDPSSATLVRDNCLNSGSVSPGLSQALSGDVTLPSAPLPGHPLILIDRTNNALVWVNPADCSVTREMSVSTGFAANPHDVVAVATNKIYVTRYASNPKPTPDPADLDEGGDLLVVDIEQGQAVGRIDLTSLATGGAGFNPNPDRGLALDGRIYVTLNSFNADWHAGPGRVVVIDPASDTVSGIIDLPGFSNCGAIAPLPGQPAALAVVCAGSFADGAGRIDASGVALIDTSTTPPSVSSLAATAFGRPLSMFDLTVVSPALAFAVVPGSSSGSPADQLWRFDFAGGVPQPMLAAGAGFVFGGLVFDPGSQHVFLADADAQAPKLHVLDVGVSPLAELPPLSSNPGQGLLPRSLGLY